VDALLDEFADQLEDATSAACVDMDDITKRLRDKLEDMRAQALQEHTAQLTKQI
jgi:hypothetical protein